MDVYYWPEPDANMSCLSTIGENVRPLDYGATTATFQGQGTPVTTITSTYWGCTVVDSYFQIASQRSVTDSYVCTTAEISQIGSLTVKISSLSPWSSSPCNQDDTGSHPSNQTAKVRDRHALVYARDHSLVTPSPRTQTEGLPVSTMVSGNFTL